MKLRTHSLQHWLTQSGLAENVDAQIDEDPFLNLLPEDQLLDPEAETRKQDNHKAVGDAAQRCGRKCGTLYRDCRRHVQRGSKLPLRISVSPTALNRHRRWHVYGMSISGITDGMSSTRA